VSESGVDASYYCEVERVVSVNQTRRRGRSSHRGLLPGS
jgi:hypothetical protein